MSAEALLRELSDSGVELRPDGDRLRFRAPSGTMTEALRQSIAEHRDELLALLHAGTAGKSTVGKSTAGKSTAENSAAENNGGDRSFELTDLQRAYWLGAQGLYPLSTTAYVRHEYQVDRLDPGALHRALVRLVARHEVLRAVVREDGTQLVRAEVPVPPPPEVDLAALSGPALAEALEEQRAATVADLPGADAVPPFAVRAVKVHNGHRVLLVLRLSALDGKSLRRFLAELAELYLRPAAALPEPSGGYRELVTSATRPPARRREAALAHWAERARTLPPAANLPLRENDRLPDRSEFVRRHLRLSGPQAAVLRERSSRHGLTVSSVLCTAFVSTLRRWSSTRDFTLNVLSSLRPVSGEADDVLGNLGTTVLVECPDGDGSFTERVRVVQERLYAAVAHSEISGLEVLRRFSTAHRSAASSFMPVVFAPGQGVAEQAERPELTAPGWRLLDAGIHTPQVLLDHQVYGDGTDLVLNWDAVPGAFPDGLLDAAFGFYRSLLERLLRADTEWDRFDPAAHPLPEPQLTARHWANRTAGVVPEGLLQDGFLAVAERSPERTAVLDGQHRVRFGELRAHAIAIARRLRAAGVGAGDLVAVRAARRGPQVAAVLGVLQAGAAYLPLDSGWPAERVAWLLEQSGARAVLTDDASTASGTLPMLEIDTDDTIDTDVTETVAAQDDPVREPDELAYVIYTSGSTGRPKGVAITHRAANNTVRDITDRFGLTEDDRTLCLSALNFDLSVFDLFGLLGAGGALVGVEPGTPDPAAWAELVREHRVTVWNSVPAIMELALDHLGDAAADYLGSLRLVLLSGDWIPVSLPERIRAIGPRVRLIALGGATEASIWSNSFPVGVPEPGWPSVPYGHPLTNQRMHVLDRNLADVPDWVPGELYIAGTGLATGYHNDPEKTAASFPHRPGGGERLYRTGDLARYRPDGCLEFLGRADNQVKIDGYRIELGEIESTLLRTPGVRAAAVVVVDDRNQGRRMAAFVTGDPGTAPEPIRAALAEWLPGYMVPRQLAVLERLPLTANGKVDRTRLVALAAEGTAPENRDTVAPRDGTERALAGLWTRVLGLPETPGVSATDDFFALGGSSRAAVQLMNLVREQLDPALGLRTLFEHPVLREQAAAIGRAAPSERSLVQIRSGTGDGYLVLMHPIGGGVLCYRELAGALPPGPVVLGAQHPGLDGEQAGASVPALAECYAEQLERAAPGGQVVLAGWSMGGVIALELAAQLAERGTVLVDRVVVLDGWAAADPAAPLEPGDDAEAARDFLTDFTGGRGLPGTVDGADAAQVLREGFALLHPADPELREPDLHRLFQVYRANYAALRGHTPRAPECPVDLFRALRPSPRRAGLVPVHEVLDPAAGSGSTASMSTASMSTVDLDTDHFGVVSGPAAGVVAGHLGACFQDGPAVGRRE